MATRALFLFLITLMTGGCSSLDGLSMSSPPAFVKADEPRPAATLEKVGELPEAAPRLKLQFIDERRGWAASDKKLWLTVDGGRSWTAAF